MTFVRDFRESQRSVAATIKLLIKEGFASGFIQPPKGYCLENDGALIIDGKQVLTEYKHDRMAKDTGNIAIECFNPRGGKMSGIQATNAKLYVYTIPNFPESDKTTIGVIDVEVLKANLEDKSFFTKIIPMGDKYSGGKAAYGYIVPIKNYLAKCKKTVVVDAVI